MINVGRVVLSSRLVQTFQVKRRAGSYIEGRWTEVASGVNLTKVGIVQPAKQSALEVLPEGEQNVEALLIHTKDEIIMGNSDNLISDIIIWQGAEYRVAFKKPWQLNGFSWVIAVKL